MKPNAKNIRAYGKSPFQVAVVHGGPGAAGEMAPVARVLAADYGVLEPLQTEHALDSQVDELKAALVQYGDLPLAVIGYSWGAWLAWMLAAVYPLLVKKLILVGCGGFEEKYGAQTQANRMQRFSEADRKKMDALLSIVHDVDGQERNRIFAQMGLLFSKIDAYDPLMDESDGIECRADIFQSVWKEAERLRRSGRLLQFGKHIQCPVVAIHGEYDPHPAEGVVNPLSTVLRDFRYIPLARCGHTPWIERQAKDRFYEVLNDELR